MIAHLSGVVARKDAGSVVLDVQGVGYRVSVPASALAELPAEGQPAFLHTVMAVREDDISLYGFVAALDLDVFQLAMSVAGVGPKLALAMLGSLRADEIAAAIASNDVRSLTRVPGVGQKLAQRIVLELGERMSNLVFERRVDALAARATPAAGDAFEDVVGALVNLGYSRSDSRRAAERVSSNAGSGADVGALVRDALSLLSGDRR